MADPALLESTIEELLDATAGLNPGGTAFSGASVTVTGNVTADGYVVGSAATGLTAVGTNRATALQLAAQINNVTGGATGTGVVLPDLSGAPGADVIVFNENSSAIKVYATGSQTIDGTAGSTGVTLTNAKRCIYFMISATAWISAQLGVASA